MLELFKQIRNGFVGLAFMAAGLMQISLPVSYIFLKNKATSNSGITADDIRMTYFFLLGIVILDLIGAFVLSVQISAYEKEKNGA